MLVERERERERERLMILVIVGRRTEEHCFRREVGIGSKSQLVSGESVSSLDAEFTFYLRHAIITIIRNSRSRRSV